MKKEIKNLEASIRARLKNIAKESGKTFDAILLQYFQERFLYRLSISRYKENFILKGALLFIAYNFLRSRPTIDIDFLGKDISNTPASIINAFKDILERPGEDGLRFDSNSLVSENIMLDSNYKGIRLHCVVYLGKAYRKLHFDVGFGDVVIPEPVILDFPILLADIPAPVLIAYTPETAIAEKFEAIVNLGLITSRMKDFYDIYYFSGKLEFKSGVLSKAIKETFNRRNTKLSNRFTIYQEEFKHDKEKQIQWKAFIKRQEDSINLTFFDCIEKIEEFVEPMFLSDEERTWKPEMRQWIIKSF